jgi:pyridoxal phosphate enzyme (YggS family)
MGDFRLVETLRKLNSEISEVAQKYQRPLDKIKLVAVSKKQPVEKIFQAIQSGHLDFGENYVQEALEKMELIKNPQVRWHLIGPLQKNKVNKIIGKFYLIHSVDTLDLAKEISQKSEKIKIVQPVMIQVNLANEETKSGFSKEDLLKKWEDLQKLDGIFIQGLMTMPPLENSEIYFEELKNLAQTLRLKELSMGTTSDWPLALKHGATYIRIGTAVFGERE